MLSLGQVGLGRREVRVGLSCGHSHRSRHCAMVLTVVITSPLPSPHHHCRIVACRRRGRHHHGVEAAVRL
jgi:hypothetical protein